MSNPIIAIFLKSAVLPAVLAVIAVFVTGGLPERLRARVHAAVIALSFFLGTFLLIGRMQLPPTDAIESLAVVALLLIAFVAVFPGVGAAPYWLRAVSVVLIGGVVLWHLRSSLNSEMHLRNMLAFFCLGLGVWSIVERSSSNLQPLTLLALPLISATGLSMLKLFSASASMSQQVSVLCTILGALSVVALVFPGRLSKASLVPFVSVMLVAMMAAGHFYLEINPWRLIILCSPFLVIWVRGYLSFVPKNPLAEAAILGALSAAPVAYIVWVAFKSAGPLY